MPEIDILHVWEWTGKRMVGDTGNPSYSVERPDGSLVWSETEDFGVEDLASLGAEYGVTRWSERTAEDGLELDAEVVVVGWAEAPIARDDVETHYDRQRNPAVNIKVYDTDLPKGDEFKAIVDEHDLDERLKALPLDELRSLIDAYIEKHQHVFYGACEDNYEQAKEDAIGNIFIGRKVEIWQEGRSGGWMVVRGLPDDINEWDAELLTQWHEFSECCKSLVADVPRAMVWTVLANCQDELAGRVVRVELTLTLSDEDLEEAGDDPTEWDWRDMLDLGVDSQITVRRLTN